MRSGEICGRHDERWRLSTNFPKSAYLYNYGRASQSSSPFVLLVEGAGEVWRCTEANVPAVACLGAELTNSQAEKVAALNKKIYIAFDNDEAGNEGSRRALSQLSLLGVDISLLSVPAGFKDVAEMRAADVIAWLNEVAQADYNS